MKKENSEAKFELLNSIVNGIYLLSRGFGGQVGVWWEGTWKHPHTKILGITKGMAMKFYQLLLFIRRHGLKNCFCLPYLVCKLRVLEIQLLGMATSRNCRIINIDSEIGPENFRPISKRLVFLQSNLQNAVQIWSVKYEMAQTIDHVTSSNLLGDVVSSIFRH